MRVRGVRRGRDVDEERARSLSPGAQLIPLPGGVQQQSQPWIPSEGEAQPRRRSGGEAGEAAKESRAGEKSNLCLELGFFFANAKGNMQHIFAFFCTSFLGAVLGANFPNNIQIGECRARGWWGAMHPGKGVGVERGRWGKTFACKGKMCVWMCLCVGGCVRARGGEQRGMDLCVGPSFARAEMYQFGFGGGEDWD